MVLFFQILRAVVYPWFLMSCAIWAKKTCQIIQQKYSQMKMLWDTSWIKLIQAHLPGIPLCYNNIPGRLLLPSNGPIMHLIVECQNDRVKRMTIKSLLKSAKAEGWKGQPVLIVGNGSTSNNVWNFFFHQCRTTWWPRQEARGDIVVTVFSYIYMWIYEIWQLALGRKQSFVSYSCFCEKGNNVHHQVLSTSARSSWKRHQISCSCAHQGYE